MPFSDTINRHCDLCQERQRRGNKYLGESKWRKKRGKGVVLRGGKGEYSLRFREWFTVSQSHSN
jgi:hypothetical protein